MKPIRPVPLSLVLGCVHALVDASCAFVLFRDLSSSPRSDAAVAFWIVLYDVLAFASQVPLGALSDRFRASPFSALVGVTLAVIALLVAPGVPTVAVVVAGLGNALFHVGAGSHVLSVSEGRAREIGLFVGPGAVGLCLGILAGQSDLPLRAPLALGLVAAGWCVWRLLVVVGRPSPGPSRSPLPASVRVGVSLILLTVISRSLLGDTFAFAAREHAVWLVVGLAVSAALGKGVGGFAGDRFGWGTTAFVALVLAAPLLVLAPAAPLGVLVGGVLLQATMPLTVKAVHGVLPNQPGLAFGLPSAALLLGAVPGLANVRWLSSQAVVVGVALASAGSLVLGLRLLRRNGLPVGPPGDSLLAGSRDG